MSFLVKLKSSFLSLSLIGSYLSMSSRRLIAYAKAFLSLRPKSRLPSLSTYHMGSVTLYSVSRTDSKAAIQASLFFLTTSIFSSRISPRELVVVMSRVVLPETGEGDCS